MEEGCAIACKGKFAEWLTEDGLHAIEGWARDGLADTQIARNMGISYSTFKEWLHRFPAILSTLKKGKAPVDVEVENALLKRAKGYRYTEVTTEYEMVDTGEVDKDGKPVLTKRVKSVRSVEKEVAPDTGAAAFWLKNRRPDRWKDKREEQIQVTAADYTLLDEVAKAVKQNAV